MKKAKTEKIIPGKSEIKKELNKVLDPETGIGLVDMGLVYNIKSSLGKVFIEMTLTTVTCPLGPQIATMAISQIKKMEGVKSVDLQFVFEPAWTIDKMNPKVRAMLF